jgi:hypothetical protein
MTDPMGGSRTAPTLRLLALALLGLLAGCSDPGKLPEIKGTGVFIQSAGALIEVPKLGTLGTTYGPRLYPELPDYDIPVVPDVGPIYVNIPGFPLSTLEGIEWHGYRLGGNGAVGSRSTATPADWKSVRVTAEQTRVPGLLKIVVAAADATTGRWKPELSHEYFGITTGDRFKGSPVWAVRIK